MIATLKITEQELDGRTIYHWQIVLEDGNEFSHSAYHTDRAECEAEGNQRLAYAREQGWVD